MGQSSIPESTVKSMVTVLLVSVALGAVVGVFSQGTREPPRNILKKTKSFREFSCCAELEPGVGPCLPCQWVLFRADWIF